MKALVTCALLACFSALALAADSDANNAEQQITARSKAFSAAWAKGDSRALGEFYAENAELVIANLDVQPTLPDLRALILRPYEARVYRLR